MKKLLFSIFLLLVVPLQINAAEISEVSVFGLEEKKIGEELSLSYDISFDGIEKGYDKSLGVWIVSFALEFDEDIFIITDVSSANFETAVYKDADKYYVVSQVMEYVSRDNNCANGILYCGDYAVTLKFYIKDTKEESAAIIANEFSASVLDVKNINEEYTLEDTIQIEIADEISHTVKINQSDLKDEKVPKSIVGDSNPIKEPTKITDPNQIAKSSNAYLSSLEISNYDIIFNKMISAYTISIEEEINALDIVVIPEDSKATYKIVGADDLKANDYKVVIEVTAENMLTKTYTINAEIKQKEDTSSIIAAEEKDNNDQELIIYIGIAIGIIVLLSLIILIILKIRSRNIDKLLKEL